MKRRSFFKILGAVGLAPAAIRATLADGGVSQVVDVEPQYSGEFWETLTTGLNEHFYSVLHQPTGIRMNVRVPKHQRTLSEVSRVGIRDLSMKRIYAEIERRKQYGETV